MTATALPIAVSPGAQPEPPARSAARRATGPGGPSTAGGFQAFLPASEEMPQTTAVSGSHARKASETAPPESDGPGGSGRKAGAPQRPSKDKEDKKGKQILDALCPLPLARDVVTLRVSVGAAEFGDRFEPATGMSAGEAGPDASVAAAQVSAAPDGARPIEAAAPASLAFAGRLVMATPEIEPVGGHSSRPAPSLSAVSSLDSQAPPVSSKPDSPDTPESDMDPKALRGRQSAETASRTERGSTDALPQDRAASDTFLNPPTETAAPARHSGNARADTAKAAAEPPAPPADLTPKNSIGRGPAREIALELSRGDARVDVRLSERRGEVLVSVRTPDARLAGELRGDLPSLAARLEETGLHAAAWHSDSGFGRQQERSPDPQSQESWTGGGERQDRRRDDRQQEQGGFAPRAKTQNRKDFAWFMTSLG